MSRLIKIAAVQAKIDEDIHKNLERMRCFVENAARDKAQIILLPELFDGHYFCRTQEDQHFARAHEVEAHPSVRFFQKVSQDFKVFLPISFYEKSGPHYFNSVAMIDSGGKILGVYRKSHIPDGPGYQEKFYFKPGNSGFKVWDLGIAKIGVGICWDQWFPEAARAMALQGAEILFYPTAIGSEPQDSEMDTKDPWQRAMVGHAVANATPVVAANRVGVEGNQRYYGSSFICDQRGDFVDQASRDEEKVLMAEFDLDQISSYQASFGFFRDRRPELYSTLVV